MYGKFVRSFILTSLGACALAIFASGCGGGGASKGMGSGGAGQPGTGGVGDTGGNPGTGGASGLGGAGTGGGAATCDTPMVPAIPADGQMTWVACEPGIGLSTYSSANTAYWSMATGGSQVDIFGNSASPVKSCHVIMLAAPATVGTFPIDAVAAIVMPCATDNVQVYTAPAMTGQSAGTVTITSFDGMILKGTATFTAAGYWSAGSKQITSSLAVAFAVKKL